MASNVKISVASMNAGCDAIVDLVDVSPPGILEVFTGAPPVTPATADSGTKLATLTFSNPAFGNAGVTVNGRADASAITDDSSAAANGDAGYFRVKDGAGVVILQGTAGEAADTPDMTFDVKAIVITGVVSCSSFQVTVPEQ